MKILLRFKIKVHVLLRFNSMKQSSNQTSLQICIISTVSMQLFISWDFFLYTGWYKLTLNDSVRVGQSCSFIFFYLESDIGDLPLRPNNSQNLHCSAFQIVLVHSHTDMLESTIFHYWSHKRTLETKKNVRRLWGQQPARCKAE